MAAATTESPDSAERGYRSLSSLFRPVQAKTNKCHRCEKAVYHAEKVGPVNEALYHKQCFKCKACGQHLNLKNYWSNQTNTGDKDIYCYSHVPRVGGTSLDPRAIGIKSAVDAQKGYQKMSKKLRPQVREPGTLRIPSYGMQALEMKRAISVTKERQVVMPVDHSGGQMDSDAVGIRGPLDAQRMFHYDKNVDSKHHYPPNIVSISYVTSLPSNHIPGGGGYIPIHVGGGGLHTDPWRGGGQGGVSIASKISPFSNNSS